MIIASRTVGLRDHGTFISICALSHISRKCLQLTCFVALLNDVGQPAVVPLLFSAEECTLRSYLCSYLTVSVQKSYVRQQSDYVNKGIAFHDCAILNQHRNQYYCIILKFRTSLHVYHTCV